jgi:hypothetical protein
MGRGSKSLLRSFFGCRARNGRAESGAQCAPGGGDWFSCLLGSSAIAAMVQAAKHGDRDKSAFAVEGRL